MGHDGMQAHPTYPVKGCFVVRETTDMGLFFHVKF